MSGLYWCPRCGESSVKQIDQPVCDECEKELDKEARRQRKQNDYDRAIDQKISEWKERRHEV